MTTAPVGFDRRGGGDRRAQRASFHYPERRSGFDRRADPGTAWSRLLATYRDRPAAVAATAVLIAVLGAADVILTWRLLAHGATEANPVMAALFDGGLGWALVLKAAVTLPVAASVWWLRRYRRVLEFSLIAMAVFAALITYQAVALLVVG
jgi:hypothetical protein